MGKHSAYLEVVGLHVGALHQVNIFNLQVQAHDISELAKRTNWLAFQFKVLNLKNGHQTGAMTIHTNHEN